MNICLGFNNLGFKYSWESGSCWQEYPEELVKMAGWLQLLAVLQDFSTSVGAKYLILVLFVRGLKFEMDL